MEIFDVTTQASSASQIPPAVLSYESDRAQEVLESPPVGGLSPAVHCVDGGSMAQSRG